MSAFLVRQVDLAPEKQACVEYRQEQAVHMHTFSAMLACAAKRTPGLRTGRMKDELLRNLTPVQPLRQATQRLRRLEVPW